MPARHRSANGSVTFFPAGYVIASGQGRVGLSTTTGAIKGKLTDFDGHYLRRGQLNLQKQ